MRVGIIQSAYIPWRGYFDFISSVDLFIFLDDVQYTARDWRNRNRIKTRTGLKWLSVPVVHVNREQSIENTNIDNSRAWSRTHREQFYHNYRSSPYCKHALDIFQTVLGAGDMTISKLNRRFIGAINQYLEIYTPLVLSSDMGSTGRKTDRLIALLKKTGATTYLSGPSADAYLDKDAFLKAGIRLEYKSYDYPAYPQLWGDFEGGVTVMDLIANCGPDSRNYLRSNTPNRIVVP